MRLYVVRHAHAGSRSRWDGPDERRPLTTKGRRQAEAIADALAPVGVSRMVSSPYRRCTQTLDPLADRIGVGVEEDERLAEGADGVDALALADELRKQDDAAVVCSHGDVIPEMLRILKATTARFKDPFVWPKASTWVVTWDGERWAKARYIAPPEIDAW
ncbi:MAG: histidine phosphatase family protein [Acidimicrobiales bacterium]|nr:histidine phosphatase family protein [Acidimicrobiales bacterium]